MNPSDRAPKKNDRPRLTQKELALLQVVVEGHTPLEIMKAIGWGVEGMQIHLRGLLEKLDAIILGMLEELDR